MTKNEMHVQRDSFFRIFSSELRGALQYFFENRRARITPEIASEFVDLATLERLVAMGLIEFDGESISKIIRLRWSLVLTYESDAYSRYDGPTAYVFSQVGTDRKRVWDLHDDEDLASWRDLFEEAQ